MQTIDCDVQLAAPMSSWQAAYVAEEVIKHLLFMRNMIPSLFHDLAEKVLVRSPQPQFSQPPCKTPSLGFKKLQRCVCNSQVDCNMESDPNTPHRKHRRPGGQRKVEKVSTRQHL